MAMAARILECVAVRSALELKDSKLKCYITNRNVNYKQNRNVSIL